MTCKHAQPTERRGYSLCVIGVANLPHESFCAKCRRRDDPENPVEAPKSLPRDKWPIWAILVALNASEADTGVGDTIARTVGVFGGEAVKAWFKSHGKDCGCDARQDTFNAKYPYRT